jgi:DNA-binding CsgD family transcriptional regulator
MSDANAQLVSGGLLGRDREIERCDALLEARSGVLLLRGSPGVGKSSLLEGVGTRARARGFCVHSAAGSEAETTLPYAGLQPLLLPLVDADTEMPDHLRTALLSALGLIDAEVPALETIGLATLMLLAGVADPVQPLCLLVDDVQWLDASSAEVLRFVSRRLSADPVLLFAASRDDGWPPVGTFPEMRIEPLDPASSEALLVRRAVQLPKVARDRVLEQAEGNPLALVELSGVVGEPIEASKGLPVYLPLTARLESAFTGRAARLPGAARSFMLVSALAPTATIPEALAAASLLADRKVHLADIDEAVAMDLISVDASHVHFRHPLVRSGLVHIATVSQRLAAHEALAKTLEDRERALYHRAAATVGYDSELADELDTAAARALRRGALASAVSNLEHSARLTRPGSQYGGRLVRAAELSFELGRAGEVKALLSRIEERDLEIRDRVVALRLTMAVDRSDTHDTGSVWRMTSLATEAITAGAADAALQLLLLASEQIIWGGQGLELGRAIVAAAREVPGSDTDPRVTALLARSLPIEGHRELADRLNAVDEAKISGPESLWLIAAAAVIYGDYERGGRLLSRAEEWFRSEGRLAGLATVLTFRGVVAFSGGEWRLAGQILDEAERLAAETNQPGWLNRARQLQAGLAGLQGDEERHRAIVAEQMLTYQRTQASHRQNHLVFMQGIAAAMLGHHDDALALLGGLFDPADPIFDPRSCYEAMFYLADVAAVKNRVDVIENAIRVLDSVVPAPWPPLLQSGIDYARAVTAVETEAGQRFEAALAGPAGARTFDRARVELAYGQWLRRHQRRLEAREQLRSARDRLERLGNEPLARRARDELRATGEGSPRRRNADWDQLSAQELQIAGLVAEGLSNKEIGERMFLSHRTIASHLYRIFPKLGITSRSQLAAAMSTD